MQQPCQFLQAPVSQRDRRLHSYTLGIVTAPSVGHFYKRAAKTPAGTLPILPRSEESSEHDDGVRAEARPLRKERLRTTRTGESMKCIPLLTTAAAAACFAIAMGASAQTTAGTTPSTAASETMGQHVGDATITTKVKAELLGAKNVKSEHIHVKTRKGVVWLTGSVPTHEDRDNAVQVVQNVAGVESVKNHLKVASTP
jgi:hypothetical protein